MPRETLPRIRAYEPADRDRLLALGERLTVGVAPWRPTEGAARAVAGWVRDAVERHDEDHPLWVAEVDGEVVGFVAGGESAHWTGTRDAYVGELVVDEAAGRRGVGSDLLARMEQWARQRGLKRIRLETGAANAGALAFYARHGFATEEVVLSRGL